MTRFLFLFTLALAGCAPCPPPPPFACPHGYALVRQRADNWTRWDCEYVYRCDRVVPQPPLGTPVRLSHGDEAAAWKAAEETMPRRIP